jgi:6,7-dimethyl-8-ribityllumazine synthase
MRARAPALPAPPAPCKTLALNQHSISNLLVTILKLPYTPFVLATALHNDNQLTKSMPSTDGATAKGFRFAIVASRWNDSIVSCLIDGARDALAESQADAGAINVFRVPGSFEIPLCALKAAQSGKFAAVICLGVIVRGETPHFEYIAAEVARGIGEAGLLTGVPVLFGVITAENINQAVDRAGARMDNKGFEAAMAAVELVNLYHEAFQK